MYSMIVFGANPPGINSRFIEFIVQMKPMSSTWKRGVLEKGEFLKYGKPNLVVRFLCLALVVLLLFVVGNFIQIETLHKASNG